jgi:hypothetical protein
MTGHGSKLGRKKDEAIAALLSNRTVEDAARAAGIAPRTLWRWLRLAEFQAEFLQARRQAVSQAHARLQQSSGTAAAVLLKVMADPGTPAAVKVRAAACVLERSEQSLELDDILLRLQHLEEAAENKEPPG